MQYDITLFSQYKNTTVRSGFLVPISMVGKTILLYETPHAICQINLHGMDFLTNIKESIYLHVITCTDYL